MNMDPEKVLYDTEKCYTALVDQEKYWLDALNKEGLTERELKMIERKLKNIAAFKHTFDQCFQCIKMLIDLNEDKARAIEYLKQPKYKRNEKFGIPNSYKNKERIRAESIYYHIEHDG